MTFFTKAAAKAQVAAIIAFLSPLLIYIGSTGDWSWRAFAGAVVSGLISGVSVFYTPRNEQPDEVRHQLRDRHHDEEPPQ